MLHEYMSLDVYIFHYFGERESERRITTKLNFQKRKQLESEMNVEAQIIMVIEVDKEKVASGQRIQVNNDVRSLVNLLRLSRDNSVSFMDCQGKE